ncbi:hypothetical protein VMCG_04583 [Cytospora schulzeri]|uniref:SPX domain-containing protein n=1 Tax=Cytospora schulzeri TaxID=448051 RepID=A0A423WS16_9PEZI|nr:hypothetical protein VMCG_04583 [Valsa malicola]
MKFAKELERDLVPEWRIKYLNYKQGKKKCKAISRALARADATPSLNPPKRPDTPSVKAPTSGLRRDQPDDGSSDEDADEDHVPAESAPMVTSPLPRSIATRGSTQAERQGLTQGPESDLHYGSFIPTPPERNAAPIREFSQLFELPAPAMKVPSNVSDAQAQKRPHSTRTNSGVSLNRIALNRSASMAGTQPGTSSARAPTAGHLRPSSAATFVNRTPSDIQTPRSRLRRMFSTTAPPLDRYRSRGEYHMHGLDDVREKEGEFFEFMDSELEKVEAFYRQKEDHAGKRLVLLREQLHEMRNRRTSEIAEAKRRKREGESNGHHAKKIAESNGASHRPLLEPLKAKIFKPGPNSKALQKMTQTTSNTEANREERRDYVRRPPEDEVPYRTAKRKLKLALQEFYRGLELLKSYALLNRTAFRKLNKKYDKTVNARPPYRYMTEKVNKSWFVNSDVLDGHLQAVEDLYARYFERGNHKIAAGKLRSLSRKKRDESGSAFRNGLLIGVGAVFAIQGLVHGAQLLFDDDPEVRRQTSYVLQIYGGYFLMLYLFSLFCLDCKIWTASRVNYPFIFEFDPRNQLDWRQLAEFPSFFLFLFGLIMWLNFTRYGSPDMYLYYPVLLIFISIVILFIPAPILWHKSRNSLSPFTNSVPYTYTAVPLEMADIPQWRLFFAGLYPVEFRDFFLGDMYCSLTYATCRMRSLRRYRDTGNIFPHLVNCGKYTASILAGVFLSVYRIEGTNKNLGIYIAFSLINGFYTAFWDVFMDFSLLQSHAHHRYLRDITALKSRWPYYLIMILDPILRFNWIFYAIFTHDTQHSSIASFLIAFSEVTRRGMWTLLRVENEHCSNVAQYKASRDVPLPYQLDLDVETPTSGRLSPDSTGGAAGGGKKQQEDELVTSPSRAAVNWTGTVLKRAQSGKSTGVEVTGSGSTRRGATGATDADGVGGSSAVEEGGQTPGDDTMRMRRRQRADTIGKRSITRILADAHKQDFEKKRKPSEAGRGGQLAGPDEAEEEFDEDEDDDDLGGTDDDDVEETGSLLDERMEVREAEMLSRKGRDDDGEN